MILTATLNEPLTVLPADQTCLQAAKQEIQHRYALGENGRMRQRDFMYLIDRIEQTAQIRISLSTLKRIWQAELKHLPQPATLDALVSLLDYPDWSSFKQTLSSKESKPSPPQPSPSQAAGAYNQFSFPVRPVIAICLILGIGFAIWANWESPAVRLNGPVSFKVDQTVRIGVPNTFIFTYDLQAVEADSFFIQQSWDPRQKTAISHTGEHHSTVYMRPGSHTARLIANDSVLATCLVNVKTDGWLSYAEGRGITYLPPVVTDMSVALLPDSLRAWNINPHKTALFSCNIRDFPTSSMQRFRLDARLKALPWENLYCPVIGLVLHGETGIIRAPVGDIGCVGNLGMRIGSSIYRGAEHDLSGLGVADLQQWQQFRVEASTDSLRVFINEDLGYTVPLDDDLGEIKGIGFRTNTPFAVESVQLNGERVD